MRAWLCCSLQALQGSSGSAKRAEAGSARTKGSPGSAPSPCTSPWRLLKRREWSRFQHLPRGPRGHAAASPPSPCIRCRSRGHASPAHRGGTAAGRPEASGEGGGTAGTQRRFLGAAPRLLAAAGAAGVRLPPAVQLVHPGAAGLGHGTPTPRTFCGSVVALPCPAQPAADGPPALGPGSARGPLSTQTPINLSSCFLPWPCTPGRHQHCQEPAGSRRSKTYPEGPAGAAAKVAGCTGHRGPGGCPRSPEPTVLQSVPGCCGAGLAPVQGLPAALSCCRGSSARPGHGGSAWRQHGLPYLSGKLGAGSVAPRGIRVPFTLAALLWRGLPPSQSARGGAWPQGQPGGPGGQRGPLPGGAQPIPAAPSRCCGQGWGLADGAVVLRPTAPPFPSTAHVPGAVPAQPLPCSHVSPRCSVRSRLLATPLAVPDSLGRQPGSSSPAGSGASLPTTAHASGACPAAATSWPRPQLSPRPGRHESMNFPNGEVRGRRESRHRKKSWLRRAAGRAVLAAPRAQPHAQPQLLAPSSAAHTRRCCPMFRSRRAALVRRLWRQRCAAPGPEDGHGALKPAAHALFKKLKDEELELLVQAVESRGAWESGCVWAPRGDPRGAKQVLPPQVLLCRLYRWPDLRQPHELKHLSYCQSAGGRGGCGDAAALCCNPHHFSRLAVPETPPPPYSKSSFSPSWPAEPEHPQLLEFSYNRVEWHDTSLSRSTIRDGYWCKLAYWEHRTRVGRLYAVHEASVNVFCELPRGSGFCLGQLPAAHRSQAVRRARGKIGRGLLLSREPGGVWAYNRSEHPIFVSSPTLGPPGARGLAVLKVLPGYSVKVFDYERVGGLAGWRHPGDGPCDTHSVRISFGKGWGPCYSRQFITSCPCWLEVLLNQPR